MSTTQRKVTRSFGEIVFAFIAFIGVSVAAQQDNIIGPFSGLNNADTSVAITNDKAQDLLNVDLSLGGRSVKKRKGFSLAYALSITTSPVHGVYDFYDTNGNDIALAFNDTRMTSSINGGAISVLLSTGPLGVTYQCTDSQGFGYCVDTNLDPIIKTNGVTYTPIVPANNGKIITVTPDRLVLAGFSSAPNRVDFSAAADFTTWTTGVSPTSAFNFTISAPGSHITHLAYAFNRVFWFKDTSFGYILQGATAADWVVQTISPNVGTIDNSSVFYQGILYFRGNDSHIWAYDGSNLTKLTRDINGTISQSQIRSQNSWLQTTGADFNAGASTPTTWVDTTSIVGAFILQSSAAVNPFLDDTSANFGAANTFVNVDTTSQPGSVVLSTTSIKKFNFNSVSVSSEIIGSAGSCPSSVSQFQQFLATYTYFISSITVSLQRDSSYSGGVTISLNGASGTAVNGLIGTSQGDVNVILSTQLVAGTTYSLTVTPTSTSGNGPGVYWFYDTAGSPYSLNASSNTFETKICPGVCACGSSWTQYTQYAINTRQYRYSVYGSSYNVSGSILSRTFDVGFTTASFLWAWSTFQASETIPSGTSLSYQTQTSSSSSGVFETLTSSFPTNTVITSSVQEFIRYKATLTSSNGLNSPLLNSATIYLTNMIRPGATFYSAIHNAPNLSSWDTFQVTKQDNGGNNVFSIRSSTMNFSILSSTPTWALMSAGAVPTISTGVYFQIADHLFVSSVGALTNSDGPKVYDFTQNWFEGNATDKAYATYYKDSIWWSIASGAGSTTNNTILKYDLLNNTWLKYDIPANGFYLKNTNLYFGSSTSGNVFKYGDTDNDNGSAINAYWKSKDFFNESPFTDSDITRLSLFFGTVANSSMTVTYTLVGISSTSYTVPLYRPNASFGISNKNLIQGTIGNTFNVKFGNNAVDQPFEVFSILYATNEKPWRPGDQ